MLIGFILGFLVGIGFIILAQYLSNNEKVKKALKRVGIGGGGIKPPKK